MEKILAVFSLLFLLILCYPQINTMTKDSNFTSTQFGQTVAAVVPVFWVLGIIALSCLGVYVIIKEGVKRR
jgi:vacuolar-type H+-ATPase subunit I/STV1